MHLVLKHLIWRRKWSKWWHKWCRAQSRDLDTGSTNEWVNESIKRWMNACDRYSLSTYNMQAKARVYWYIKMHKLADSLVSEYHPLICVASPIVTTKLTVWPWANYLMSLGLSWFIANIGCGWGHEIPRRMIFMAFYSLEFCFWCFTPGWECSHLLISSAMSIEYV